MHAARHLAYNHFDGRLWHKAFLGKSFVWVGNASGGDSLPFEVDDEGKKVMFFANRVLMDSHYMLWVSHDQPWYDEGYEYTVSVNSGKAYDQGRTKRIVRHSATCKSHDEPVQAISERHACLLVPEDEVKSALNKRGEYAIEILVDKVVEHGNMNAKLRGAASSPVHTRLV